MIVLLLFAFLSGLVTILAPCIWPLLPIVLSSSVAGGGHRRPLGITLGIMLSFAVFTLTISTLVSLFHFDPNILRLFAVIVIGALGLAMVVPAFNKVMELGISRLSGFWGRRGQSQGSGFGPGFVTGLSLGIVWSPCAGPILASIAALSTTGQISGALVLVTVAYVTGVGIPLFIFAYGGRSILTRTKSISPYTGRIQQVFGVIMILTAIAIFTNFDKTLQTNLLNVFPQYSQALTALESNNEVKTQLNKLKNSQQQSIQVADTKGLFNVNPPVAAPELAGVTKWLNTDKPLTLAELGGKVVLVDFWTYTCINCIRTLPHVTSWYDKYKDQGFVVLGVHTPEFEFEKNTTNVEDAIKRFKIHYPVPQDNDFATWNAFNNQYWPAEYLIDAKGQIRRAHFGEGEYDEMEQAIQALLKEAGKTVTVKTTDNLPAGRQVPDETPHSQISPETYLGARRAEYYYLTGQVSVGQKTFKTEENIPVNTYSLGGTWNIKDESMISGDKAVLTYHFTAQNVFLVMGSPTSSQVKVFLDGKPIPAALAGEDNKNGVVTVTEHRLYTLVRLPRQEEHTLRLEFSSQTETFAFTFG